MKRYGIFFFVDPSIEISGIRTNPIGVHAVFFRLKRKKNRFSFKKNRRHEKKINDFGIFFSQNHENQRKNRSLDEKYQKNSPAAG